MAMALTLGECNMNSVVWLPSRACHQSFLGNDTLSTCGHDSCDVAKMLLARWYLTWRVNYRKFMNLLSPNLIVVKTMTHRKFLCKWLSITVHIHLKSFFVFLLHLKSVGKWSPVKSYKLCDFEWCAHCHKEIHQIIWSSKTSCKGMKCPWKSWMWPWKVFEFWLARYVRAPQYFETQAVNNQL